MKTDIGAINGTIFDYEVIDNENIKVNYVNGCSQIVESTPEVMEECLSEQVYTLVNKRSNLRSAFVSKGCASMWVASAILNFISSATTNEFPVMGVVSCLNAILQMFSSYMQCNNIARNIKPVYPSLIKARLEIKKYGLYFDNENEIKKYIDSLSESNLEETGFDGTLNGVNKLTLRQMRSIVKNVKKSNYQE